MDVCEVRVEGAEDGRVVRNMLMVWWKDKKYVCF